jgi:hypothetical protein
MQIYSWSTQCHFPVYALDLLTYDNDGCKKLACGCSRLFANQWSGTYPFDLRYEMTHWQALTTVIALLQRHWKWMNDLVETQFC